MAMMMLPRTETSLESLSQAVGSLTQTLIQLKYQQGQRRINQAVTNAIAAGGGREEIAAAVAGVYQQDKPHTMMGKIFGAFSPSVPIYGAPTQTEQMLTQYGLQRAFEDPLDQRYRQARTERAEQLAAGTAPENFGIAPWWQSPRYKDTPEGIAAREKSLRAPSAAQPFDTLEITRQAKMMDSYIDAAKDAKWFWRKDYTRQNLMDAWNQYRQVNQVDMMTPTQRQQVTDLFNERIRQRAKESIGLVDGPEYDWDPSLITTGVRPQTQSIRGQTTAAGPEGLGIVPAELGPYWRSMSDEERREALIFLNQGGDVRRIIELLQ